jgi:glycosyltransferase involved in cell wall biosynthesis
MADNELRVGVYEPADLPQSFRVYVANVRQYFRSLGLEAIPFTSGKDLPRTADVLWDTRAGGGNPPLAFMLGGPPVVVTVHGFAPITLSGWEYFRTIKGTIMSRHYARLKLTKWHQLKDQIGAVITVSAFIKSEVVRLTGLAPERIAVCHHGVDTEFFHPPLSARQGPAYFLHISNGEPRKNVGRILSAFRRLRKSYDAQLWLKLPVQESQPYCGLEGVHVIGADLSTEQLATLYRGALAFLFPSLYEGFGLPILEAMSCGCPVITSNVSACPEVSGDAALTINPRDVNAILQAMCTVYRDNESRIRLAAAGLHRVRSFTWSDCSKRHADVFRLVAQCRSPFSLDRSQRT